MQSEEFQSSSPVNRGCRARLVAAAAPAILVGVCLLEAACLGQESIGTRQSVRLSEPSRPATVKLTIMNGSIHVKGNDAHDVTVETLPARRDSTPDPEVAAPQPGKTASGEPKIEEDNNVVTVQPGLLAKSVNIWVPVKCSLKLACAQAGEILVENVEGEIEASGINGSVRLLDVSGVAVVHTINGQVKASFRHVQPDKAMSFSTLNGDIDVTVPADTKATVKLETLNGTIRSGFEIQPKGSRDRSKGNGTAEGRTPAIWITERVRSGTINGGGPEFRFQAFNGTIHLRKKEK